MRAKVTVGMAAVVALAGLYLLACGSNSSSPTMPTPTTGGGGGGSAAVTISIIGMNGAQSFSPNPASVATGQTVRWVNNDPVNTHHIVQDAGAFDTGNLPPGASSSPITINSTASMPYHCSIHPSMVGTINGAAGSGGGGGGGY